MTPTDLSKPSFRRFLTEYRTIICLIMLLAFAMRLALVTAFPRTAGDENRYRQPAVNLLAGQGFSSDISAPVVPSDHVMPGYSFFIAGIFAIFGPHNRAVLIAQSLLDLLTCLLVAFVAFNLAPPSLRSLAAISALLIYGCLCWFSISWNRYILSEILATFVTMLALSIGVMTVRNERRRWLIVGLVCGVALLVRADSILLVTGVALFLLVQIVRLRTAQTVLSLALFGIAVLAVLSPWIIRNYVSLGKFQPLASAAGMPHGEFVPEGYFWWIRTWMTDQTHYKALHPALFPGSHSFDPRELPDEVFDSESEKQQVLSLLDQYDQTGTFTTELDQQFLAIAKNRIKQKPLRFFVWLPLQRMAGMWLTGFATGNALHRLFRIFLVLPILLGGIAGFIFWTQNARAVLLLLLVLITRTLAFGFLSSDEHYVVEIYPIVIAACGVTMAVALNYARRWWPSRPSPAAT